MRRWLPLAILLMIFSSTLSVVSAVVAIRDQVKADRLRESGTEMTAVIVRLEKSRNRPEILVHYRIGNRDHQTWILAKGLDRGYAEGGPIQVWVDPADPVSFVAEHGKTDDSLDFFNSWGWVIGGIALFAVGAGRIVVGVREHRREAGRRPTSRRPA